MNTQATQKTLKHRFRMILSVAGVLVIASFAQAQTPAPVSSLAEEQNQPIAQPEQAPAPQLTSEEQTVITCSEATENLTKVDLTNMLRANTGFNTPNILLKFENDSELKNWTRLTGYDEDKDLVSYKTTMVGKATNKDTGAQRSFINECEASFIATECRLRFLTCAGNSFPIAKPK